MKGAFSLLALKDAFEPLIKSKDFTQEYFMLRAQLYQKMTFFHNGKNFVISWPAY